MFQSGGFIGVMRPCYQEYYAKRMCMLMAAVCLYTSSAIFRSNRILVHSYAVLLSILASHYYICIYRDYLDGQSATICSGMHSVSVADSVEIMCLLVQMPHLPQVELLEIDINNEQAVDEVLEMRISP